MLFIDEIHRLPPAVEEILYPAMEDFQLDILIGQGPGARSMRLDLPRFTLIGATTRAGLLTSPLRDRFGWVARLEYYPPADLERILQRSARVLGVALGADAGARARARARAARRASRNRLLRRVRDFAEVDGGTGTLDRRRARALRARAPRGRRLRLRPPRPARCCARCWKSSTAGRSGSRRSPRRSARTRARSRTWSSRS